MTHEEAVAMLRPLELKPAGVWADLGAGRGRFTLALADLLGKGGTVHAVDKDKRELQAIKPDPAAPFAGISALERDFTQALGLTNLDGILLANSLHYVRNQRQLLAQLMLNLKPGGKLAVIEYETRRANPWVPFPVAFRRLEELIAKVGLPAPRQVHTRASTFGRTMYVAVTDVPLNLRG